MILKVFT